MNGSYFPKILCCPQKKDTYNNKKNIYNNSVPAREEFDIFSKWENTSPRQIPS